MVLTPARLTASPSNFSIVEKTTLRIFKLRPIPRFRNARYQGKQKPLMQTRDECNGVCDHPECKA